MEMPFGLPSGFGSASWAAFRLPGLSGLHEDLPRSIWSGIWSRHLGSWSSPPGVLRKLLLWAGFPTPTPSGRATASTSPAWPAGNPKQCSFRALVPRSRDNPPQDSLPQGQPPPPPSAPQSLGQLRATSPGRHPRSKDEVNCDGAPRRRSP
jgi:hypothetical protein